MSVAAYPAYKDSGVEWIGSIPGDWQVMTLRQLCASISTGPFGTALGSQDYVADEVPVINPSHIADGRCVPDPEITVSVATAERLASWRMAPGDLVVARRGELGRAALILPSQAGWICGTGSLRITPDAKRSVAGYLLAVLQAPYAREWLHLTSVGSTMPNISEAIIGQLPVVVPPTMAAQEAVVDFLDRETAKIDALVAEQERLMALLKEKRQAVISQAVTKGLDPNAPMKDSGVAWLGEVPAHWEVKRLKQIAAGIVVGVVVMPTQYYAEEGVPALRSLNVREMATTTDNLVYFSAASNELLAKSQLRAGDLVAVRTGKPGTTAIIGPELDGANCIDLILIRKSARFASRFVAYVMNSEVCRIQFETGSEGAIQQHFNIETAGDLRMALPPLPEQEAVAAFLDRELGRLDTLTAEATRAIALLRERRAAVISAAVTGKIDVRRLAPAAQAAA